MSCPFRPCFIPFLALVALACNRKPAAPPQMPPAEVAVVSVTPQDIPWVYSFVGQAQASQTVEVRSLVSGTILARYYTEGTDVKKGAPLYLIDPAPFEAAYRAAQAQLQQAVATLEQTQRDLGRTQALLEGGAVSQRQLDDAKTAQAQASAARASAAAAVDKAKVDLDRTRIVAEIPGRVGRTELQVGAQVPGPSVLLTTIDQLDPIYVNIPVSDNERLAFEDDIAKGRILPPPNRQWKVQLVLADSSIFPGYGTINFQELRVDQETGTTQLRAQLRNPERRLLPNQFVRAKILGATRPNALLVPQRAVQQGLQGPFVFVVTAGDTAVARDIVATAWDGGNWLIEQGLNPGDRVVVDGVQKVAAGRPVRPVPVQAGADTLAPRNEAAGGNS